MEKPTPDSSVASIRPLREEDLQTADRVFRVAFGTTQTQGVAMDRPNEPCYRRPELFVMGDWR